MEYDEVVFAVGELYLKYRKAQQVIQDLGREGIAKDQRIEELESQLVDDPIEPEEQPKPKGGKRK